MKVKSESEVTQSCPTLSDPMDCSLPGSSIHGIFQARVLEWVKALTDIAGLAALPISQAIIMVIVSVVLTLISGLIPAQSAAKKDPVIALRTE